VICIGGRTFDQKRSAVHRRGRTGERRCSFSIPSVGRRAKSGHGPNYFQAGSTPNIANLIKVLKVNDGPSFNSSYPGPFPRPV